MLSFASADRPAFLLDPGPRPTAASAAGGPTPVTSHTAGVASIAQLSERSNRTAGDVGCIKIPIDLQPRQPICGISRRCGGPRAAMLRPRRRRSITSSRRIY